MSSSVAAQQQQQWSTILGHSNNCLFLLRQLRQRVVDMQKTVYSLDSTWTPAHKKSFEKSLKDIKDAYDQLEKYAKDMPSKVPDFVDQSQPMKTLFTEEQIETVMVETVESMIDCLNWNESNFQFNTFVADFMRSTRRRATMAISQKPLVFTNWAFANSPHALFDSGFQAVQKQQQLKRQGIYMTVLEKSSVGCVIELKFGSVSPHDKQLVVRQKMLLVENCGSIEYVLLIAPHEEWSFYEHFGQKKVDITKQSRYIVYRKITHQANNYIMQAIQQIERLWTPENIAQVFMLFAKFQYLFEQPCKVCKKVLKDFLPPVICLDAAITRGKQVLHESCK